jgi:dATP pyrophosphohydrolase
LVVVYTDDLQVLLLKRVQPFTFWQSVTGSLDPGESPADTAARELLEETGLTGEGSLVESGVSRNFTIDLRWLDRYPEGVTENTEHEFHNRLEAPVDITADSSEHSDWQWVPIDTAVELVWSWTNKAALEALRTDTL